MVCAYFEEKQAQIRRARHDKFSKCCKHFVWLQESTTSFAYVRKRLIFPPCAMSTTSRVQRWRFFSFASTQTGMSVQTRVSKIEADYRHYLQQCFARRL